MRTKPVRVCCNLSSRFDLGTRQFISPQDEEEKRNSYAERKGKKERQKSSPSSEDGLPGFIFISLSHTVYVLFSLFFFYLFSLSLLDSPSTYINSWLNLEHAEKKETLLFHRGIEEEEESALPVESNSQCPNFMLRQQKRKENEKRFPLIIQQTDVEIQTDTHWEKALYGERVLTGNFGSICGNARVRPACNSE